MMASGSRTIEGSAIRENLNGTRTLLAAKSGKEIQSLGADDEVALQQRPTTVDIHTCCLSYLKFTLRQVL